MFDFGLGMSEIMIIAIVALIVVGPKDLPRLLRTIGRYVTQLRSMAGEFHRHLDAAVREAGLEDVKKEVRNMTNFTVTNDIGKQVSQEFKKQGDEMKKLLEAKPEPPAPAAGPEPAPSVPEVAPTASEPAPPLPEVPAEKAKEAQAS
ncbi:MAG TPA: Sec-independent protein translocase protein TatB [Aestuariivirgaceae bacterium]|nr:Sec-independent protein translocase protein TatB [Aestuariivirgaceae bacterium]